MSIPNKKNLVKLISILNKKYTNDLLKIKTSYHSFNKFLNNLDITDPKQYNIDKLFEETNFNDHINWCIENNKIISHLNIHKNELQKGIIYPNTDVNNLIYLVNKYKDDEKCSDYMYYLRRYKIISSQDYKKEYVKPEQIVLSDDDYKNIGKQYSNFLNSTYGSKFSIFKYYADYRCDIELNLLEIK